jgi:hypothetical protein
MNVRPLRLTALVLALACTACAGDWQGEAGRILQQVQQQGAASTLGENEIVAGLREALAQGTTNAVNQLGRTDGFWKDAAVKIPLPAALGNVEKTLRQLGQGQRLDEFQLTLNRAAEAAVPQVADIFGDAVRQMSVQDARSILGGSNDAATRYFERVSSSSLRDKILPIVQNATAKVGVTQSYKQLTAQAGPLMQLAGKSIPDLDAYVTERAMAGLFTTIAEEEARIRENPAARTTEVLRRVFGSR